MIMLSQQQRIFFEFLRFCIGTVQEVPSSLKGADWRVLYAMARKQCLVGVLFDGIKRLPADVGMDKGLLFQWMAQNQTLRKANARLDKAAVEVAEWFGRKGFRTCVLKGQGNALLYPPGMERTPGDIDLWVDGGDRKVVSFVRSLSPDEKVCYHHIGFPEYNGVEVEVHFRPSFLFCFRHNRRLQGYYERVMDEQFAHRVKLGEQGDVAVPKAEFNLIFQLTHIFTHLMNEGIGLRQLLDYFFLLKNTDFIGNTDGVSGNTNGDGFLLNTDFTDNTDRIGGNADGDGFLLNTDFTDDTDRIGGNVDGVDRRLLQDELRRLGLWEFAGAVMYIMKEVFGLEDNRLIVPPDVKRGRLVLKEVLEAGNFGQYDKRNWFGHSALGHNLQRLYRDMRLVRYFPEEALSEPFFRIWHFFWRKRIVR
ncbi:MAG: nucleotidyltransferase family protein [Prevotellaceae bacterium]|nr:nucleotidyltransferase family protein [Prevotellaceae bacterium]